jgi:hypothetical protein
MMRQLRLSLTWAWGISSFGRALEWHSRGEGFDSPILHQKGAVAHAGLEHLVCNQKVVGSIPTGSRNPGSVTPDSERGVQMMATHTKRAVERSAIFFSHREGSRTRAKQHQGKPVICGRR